MVENLTEISKDQLLSVTQDMMYNKYRFITSTCVDLGDGSMEITYHFDKDMKIKNYRIKIQKEEEIQSISNVYLCAILVENEMKELFGVNIKGIAIDYGGHMLLSDEELVAPMSKQITIVKKGEK